MFVIVMVKGREFLLYIGSVPEKQLIEQRPADTSYQSLHETMRIGRVCCDLLNHTATGVENSPLQ